MYPPGHTRTSTAAWKRARTAILQRDAHRCTVIEAGHRCTNPATEVDHVIPVSLGGTDDPTNLVAICATHHRSKTQREAAAARRAQAAQARRPSERHPGLR